MSNEIINEFESMMNERDVMLHELRRIDERMGEIAPDVVAAGRSEDEPVDVDDILEKIRRKTKIHDIEVEEQLVDGDRINTYRGEMTDQAKANAARLRKIVAVAGSLVLKAAI